MDRLPLPGEIVTFKMAIYGDPWDVAGVEDQADEVETVLGLVCSTEIRVNQITISWSQEAELNDLMQIYSGQELDYSFVETQILNSFGGTDSFLMPLEFLRRYVHLVKT